MSDDVGWQGELRLPEPGPDGLAQDEEWCEIGTDGTRRRIRFHDYAELYAIPGLYERLFYDELRCESPSTVRGLLADELDRQEVEPETLVALDVGAGNGMVGEELADLGAGSIVGVDIIEEAAAAAARDRPDVYDDYLVCDLTRLSRDDHDELADRGFNCLTSVAALGFGDIPPQAFAAAYNLVVPGGWVAFTIKEDFLVERDGTGFSGLIARMQEAGLLDVQASRRYRHRLSVGGKPLHYVALVARKEVDVPREWAEDAAA